jgi:hypothetical protein
LILRGLHEEIYILILIDSAFYYPFDIVCFDHSLLPLKLVFVRILGHVLVELISLGFQGRRHFLVDIGKEQFHRRFWFLFCGAHGIEYSFLFFLDDGLDCVVRRVIVSVKLQEILKTVEWIALLGKMFDLFGAAILRRIVARAVCFLYRRTVVFGGEK